MSNLKHIGWVGFGRFGLPAALNLLEQGFHLTAFELFNRGTKSITEAVKQGAVRSEIPECTGIDALILCLPKSEDVLQVLDYFGDNLPPLIIDLTTADPSVTYTLHEQYKYKDTLFVDCPVSGSKQNARNGELTVFVGYEEKRSALLDELLKYIGKNIYYFDSPGKGNYAKLINQFIHLSNMAIIREGLMMANAFKLDPQLLVDALSNSSANSAMMQRFGRKVVEEDYSTDFSLALAFKDLNLVHDIVSDRSLNLNYESITLNTYKKTYEKGFGDKNFTIICK
ncbi:NAD(P)-dependent oxidoreductase [Paenibacillus sp. Dod16]|uniref:NAD(P)-dependent oxidoreductase n=1 Tax=Paenibacillus sp. Dod16 TaxID=3416392 RepID=UPI003CECF87A